MRRPRMVSTLADVAQAAGYPSPVELAVAAGCSQRKPIEDLWHNRPWRIRTSDLAALCKVLGGVQPSTFLHIDHGDILPAAAPAAEQ